MRFKSAGPLVLTALFLASGAARPGDLDWSDPDRLPPPPAGAAGWPSDAPDLDALPGFVRPPPGYGEVAFYWWLGDPLTKERIAWQLDRLAEAGGVSGLQVNYAHSDSGGRTYGLTFPSDPPLFSDAWWDLFGWFVGECRKRGIAASLSDYTLCTPGQGWYSDAIIREDPSIAGSVLGCETFDIAGGGEVARDLPEGTIVAIACRAGPGGAIDPASAVDLRPSIAGRSLKWKAPAGSAWKIAVVSARPVPLSIDPLNPLSGKKVIEKFFAPFEARCPAEGGKGLNFFFSDELDLGIGGRMWSARFPAEFLRRKGYDLVPELPALFLDVGPRTPKVRLDYKDVLVALSEEGYFRPIFEWHRSRGMTYGCDHGGRGLQVDEFGDYFRTQRWMTGPGCDQPGLSSHIGKNKVASSIAHLYRRPRTWLEGYHSSGWGTTSAGIVEATFRNFVLGHNLLGFHGLYYSTHGGWWEWAPPCNHFRMPYWRHMGAFLRMTERLSYLLSQGVHRCDVAVLYPVAPVEAGMGGGEAVGTAFGIAEHLVSRGIDIDFIDFESLARARVEDRELRVSGERYRVLVLPAVRAVRESTLEKAAAFFRSGGIVVGLGALPEASDRAGRDDPWVDGLVREVFGAGAREAAASPAAGTRTNPGPGGGLGIAAAKAEDAEAAIRSAFRPDFVPSAGAIALHRRIGPRDVYAVYGAPNGSTCSFRSRGRVDLWDPWTGAVRPLLETAPDGDGTTKVRMPLDATELQIIVFSPGDPPVVAPAGEAAAPPPPVVLDGPWEFEAVPTMDNRWGDFRWPPSEGCIGPEARRFRYAPETSPDPGWEKPDLDDSRWQTFTSSFGPRFWVLGPLPGGDDRDLESRLASLGRIDPAAPVKAGGKDLRWRPLSFSWRWGIEGDPGHQGYHGLKEQVHDDLIGLGRLEAGATGTSYALEGGGMRYYLWTTVPALAEGDARVLAGGSLPAAAWLRGERLPAVPGRARLLPGPNPLLLRYYRPGRGWLVVKAGPGPVGEAEGGGPVFSEAARWVWHPDGNAGGTVLFRKEFEVGAPPSKAVLRLTGDDGCAVILNGREVGRADQWTKVREVDVLREIHAGTNALALRAWNGGGEAGAIAELTLSVPAAPALRIATGTGWRCSRSEAPGWDRPGFDGAAWAAPADRGGFEDSLWGTHPMGPPRLDAPAPQVTPSVPAPLASRWTGERDLLPFDVRPGDPRPAGWFRFTSPPGLRSMEFVARCRSLRAWTGGKEARVEERGPRPDGSREFLVTAVDPRAEPVAVALRIEEERGSYGGAAIPEPIALRCGPGLLFPGDWSRVDGLAAYSGGARYRKAVALPALPAGSRATLDLRNVVASAEVLVNDRPAGVRLASPWKFEVGELLRPGENRIEVLVYNTLANHYLTIPTRYRGSPVSGLLRAPRIEFRPPAVLRAR